MNMLILKFYIYMLPIFFLTASSKAGIPINTGTEQQIKNLQQQIQEYIENGNITSMQGGFLSDSIWSEIELLSLIDKVIIAADPNSYSNREKLAKKIIGNELYIELETYLMNVIKTSKSTGKTIIAARMLGKGMSSQMAKNVIQEKLINELKNQDQQDYKNLIYYLSDALCYIGDESGISIVKQAIEDKDSSSGRRCAAIRALTALSTNNAKTILRKNLDNVLLTQDETVAICAIKNLHLFGEYEPQLRQGLYTQLSRFATDDNIASGQNEQQLLINIASLLQENILENKLPENEKSIIKKSIISILNNRSTNMGDRVAVLFAMLANDDDKDTISLMLKSESSRYRSQGARSILTGSKKIQEYFLPDMIKMLDDTDSTTRDYALTILRRYKGEKAGTGLSQDVFEKERERIKIWWENNKDKYMSKK